MAIEIVVPRLGWSMDEGVFAQWLKRDGERVNEGDALFELESDKATQEVESFDEGILRLPPDAPKPGDAVTVGQCLGFLCAANEPVPASCSISNAFEETATETPPVPSTPPPATPTARRLARELGVTLSHAATSGSGVTVTPEDVLAAAKHGEGNGRQTATQVAVSPRAAARAVQLGVNLAELSGTGRGGRIREQDVLAASQRAQQTSVEQRGSLRPCEHGGMQVGAGMPVGGGELSPSSLTRKTIAQRMLSAAQQTAQVTLMVKADAAPLIELRTELKQASAKSGVAAPTVTSMFAKLVGVALAQHPHIQHQWREDGLFLPDGIHLAIAVDTQRGLLTPVVRDVASLSLGSLSQRLGALIERARAGQLASEDLQGGTFTISNLGGYAVDGFTPILNLPQSASLGIGRIRPEPTVDGDAVVIRDQVSLSLTFDHRVYDGADAAGFLQTLCDVLRAPHSWLVM